MSKGQLGVWAVRPGVFRIDAFAAWPATNTVLFGQAPKVYGTQGHQALFELSNLFVDLLNCACFFHIRYHGRIPYVLNAFFLPKELIDSWAESVQNRLSHLLQIPNLTLGQLEMVLEQCGRQLLLPVLAAVANAAAAGQPFQCPVCHEPLLVQEQNRQRRLNTIFGSMVLRRDYGWCETCGRYWYPADNALGLEPQAPASPWVQEIAALISIRDPYGQGAKDVERLTGVSLSCSALHREAQRQGQRALQLRQRDIQLSNSPEGLAQLSAEAGTTQLKPFTLIIEIDAWNIRERDQWGKTQRLRRKGQEPQRWHWVYTGTVFRLDQRGQTNGGRTVISQRGYVATREGLESFTQQLYVEAIRRGLFQAQEVLVIADGAIWIWNLATDRFKEAKQRVDLFHVKEHLYQLAYTLYGDGSAQAQQWLKPLLRCLERHQNGGVEVLSELEGLRQRLKSLSLFQQQALDREIGYFETHQGRMDYKDAKACGEPVGSGAVESTASQYQTRFKRSGQFWTLEGDEALLALVTFYRNERWHLLFPHASLEVANTPENLAE